MPGEESTDGLNFLERKLASFGTPIFIKNKAYRSLAGRIFAVSLAFKGKISPLAVIRNLLPSRFHKQGTDEEIFESVRANAGELFSKSGIYGAKKVKLFNKEFFPAAEKSELESWLHAFIMIFQSIAADQYHAKEFIKKDSVVIDAGANIGAFSVLAADLAKEGIVYSFEPTPRTYEVLLKNAAGYENVKPFNLALGSGRGENDLVVAESSGSNSLADSGLGLGGGERIRVRVETIDDFVRENNVQRVDFIKMDTEGYEGKILMGAKETIKRFSPVLSMSAYHHEEDKKIIPEFIRSLNPKYRCRLTQNVEDNLLFYI